MLSLWQFAPQKQNLFLVAVSAEVAVVAVSAEVAVVAVSAEVAVVAVVAVVFHHVLKVI